MFLDPTNALNIMYKTERDRKRQYLLELPEKPKVVITQKYYVKVDLCLTK